MLSAKNHWGQAVPASSCFLVGESRSRVVGWRCPGSKGRKEKKRERKRKAGHRNRRPVRGGPGPQGGTRKARPTPPEPEQFRPCLVFPPHRCIPLAHLPNEPINITRRARGRDRQSKQARLRSRQGAMTKVQHQHGWSRRAKTRNRFAVGNK